MACGRSAKREQRRLLQPRSATSSDFCRRLRNSGRTPILTIIHFAQFRDYLLIHARVNIRYTPVLQNIEQLEDTKFAPGGRVQRSRRPVSATTDIELP